MLYNVKTSRWNIQLNSLFTTIGCVLGMSLVWVMNPTGAYAKDIVLTGKKVRAVKVKVGKGTVVPRSALQDKVVLLKTRKKRAVLIKGKRRLGRGRNITFRNKKGTYRVRVNDKVTAKFKITGNNGASPEVTSPATPGSPGRPRFNPLPFSSDLLNQWHSNLIKYGTQHCVESKIKELSTWEGNIWYYDGILVFQNMAEYTGDTRWYKCADYVESVYKPYVINNSKTPGWRVFPHGLAQDYFLNKDESSRQAVIQLATNSAFAHSAGDADPEISRETAYLINAMVEAKKVGYTGALRLDTAVNYAINHLEMWMGSKTEYVKPFMVGLTMEALVLYADYSGDSRVLPVAKRTADWLWSNYWDASKKSFPYIICKRGASSSECNSSDNEASGDLNMLIAPFFAWVYSQTGEEKYANYADQIFQGGVGQAWLNGGKQFSQNYRRSFDFLRWRGAIN